MLIRNERNVNDVELSAKIHLHMTSFCVLIQIPKDLRGAGNRQSIKAKLSVYGVSVDSQLIFYKSEVITIEIPKKSIFIRTDKPIYKPVQTGNANNKLTSWGLNYGGAFWTKMQSNRDLHSIGSYLCSIGSYLSSIRSYLSSIRSYFHSIGSYLSSIGSYLSSIRSYFNYFVASYMTLVYSSVVFHIYPYLRGNSIPSDRTIVWP